MGFSPITSVTASHSPTHFLSASCSGPGLGIWGSSARAITDDARTQPIRASSLVRMRRLLLGMGRKVDGCITHGGLARQAESAHFLGAFTPAPDDWDGGGHLAGGGAAGTIGLSQRGCVAHLLTESRRHARGHRRRSDRRPPPPSAAGAGPSSTSWTVFEASFPAPRALAGELIRRGWLTPYQVNQLLQGRGRDLLLGSYVLLERLGEGGMGQVFKARNWKLGRVVALKLIRKERLDNPDAVRRFQREIRAAAQLDHPNIVRAFDADEVDGTHLLVMEYVEGTDLAKLVKKDGPLPVDKACDYCRQAALGLQHAYERGLVHRDIKPHNLLLTPGGVVKILDMGLARLDRRRRRRGEQHHDAGGGRHGHARLHRPGTGDGLARRGHPGRPLQPRLYAVLPADGPGALSGRRRRCRSC